MSASGQIPGRLGSEPLSIAVISRTTNAATLRFGRWTSSHGRIREFISYPPDIEAVTRMLKKSFDVVIIDLDSDPEYTLDLVENISAEGGTNVIVYSATVDPGLMVRCLRAGAREFLRMPITPSAMSEALVRAWARRLEAQPEQIVEEEVLPQDADGKLFVFLAQRAVRE